MPSLENFVERLGNCRNEPNLDNRFQCEKAVGKDFTQELEETGKLGKGVSSSGPDEMAASEANALIRTMEKTGKEIDDINLVKQTGLGIKEVRTTFGDSDFFVKQDNPRNILFTKQARNITDIVEDDSTTVLHQDLNRGVMVLSDEGESPVADGDIQGMEAGFAAVSEAILMDNDRKDANLAFENNTLSEIDFDTSLVEKIPAKELDQIVWQMNDEVGDKVATVLQCGGWQQAFDADPGDDCFESDVSPEFREGVKAGTQRFNRFFEGSSPDMNEVAPLATADVGERVDTMQRFAEGSGDMEFSQESLDVR